ncbi:ZZ-type zinc finger-containing protein P35G2.11c [Orchesella cincta]|uniref:ZZ-type zinc finger-containing protein P35G2.11c n=1 Tax=Orchesella cincta TaxID=48709 RepID=A0A1D2MI55_ORCCI|nr:ZZ-type zinc finger-containing protein P35G2.11c [Orchesella cincta]
MQICRILGYECNYVLDLSDLAGIIKHFKEQHTAASENTNEVRVWHADFKSCIDTKTNRKWDPILLTHIDDSGCIDSIFMIVGSVYVGRKSSSWICLQICESVENQELHHEAEFTVLNGEEKIPLFKWTLPVLKVQGLDLDDAMENCPVQIPFSFIKKLCEEVSDIIISVKVQLSNITKELDSAKKSTEMWTFNSEKKLAKTSQGSGNGESVVHPRITCDGCRQKPIVGKRHKCLQCLDYDLCENCMTAGTHSHHIFATLSTPEQSQIFGSEFPRIRQQIFSSRTVQVTTRFPENGIVSADVYCNGCQARFFVGKQYKCLQCPNYDLCESCMSTGIHDTHMFAIVTTLRQRLMVQSSFTNLRLPLPASPEYTNISNAILSSNEIVCPRVKCDGCGMQPIQGKQYKCFQCADFDLCEGCMALGTHSFHLFIMISSNEQRRLLRTHFLQIQ